jgi:hypothetical protein
VGAVTAPTVLLAACTSAAPPGPADPSPSDVVASLGAVPIPPTGSTLPTPTAAAGHPAVLAMGEPVLVRLAGTEALVTALGPDQIKSGPQPGRNPATPARITLRVQVNRGTLAIATSELSSRDETGTAVALRPVGIPRSVAGAGATTAVSVRGSYHSGSAQVTWRHDGQVLALWTFTIELD